MTIIAAAMTLPRTKFLGIKHSFWLQKLFVTFLGNPVPDEVQELTLEPIAQAKRFIGNMTL